MHRLGVVAEGLLGESLGVAALESALDWHQKATVTNRGTVSDVLSRNFTRHS